MRVRRAFLSAVLALMTYSPVNAQFGSEIQYFAQVVTGAGSSTLFAVHNPTDVAVTITAELHGSDGTKTVTPDPVIDLAPGATKTLVVTGSDELVVGWAKLTGSGRFTATEFFELTVGGQALPRVGVLPSLLSSRTKLFGFVGEGTNSGIAIANPSATRTANLTVKLREPGGSVQDEVQVSIPPLQHRPQFLNEELYFPDLQDFESIVDIESDEPVIAVMLRSDDDTFSAAALATPTTGDLTAGSVTTDLLANEAVTTAKLADNAVTRDKIADGQVVRSLNSLNDDVILAAGDNVTITPNGQTLTIAAIGAGGGGGDITAVNAGNGLSGGAASGEATLSLEPSIADYIEALMLGVQVEPHQDGPNVVLGESTNSVVAGASGATIGGGLSNTVGGLESTVAGGSGNEASPESWAFVGGGNGNEASGRFSTVSGGQGNTASGRASSVIGGDLNTASGGRSAVLGGVFNIASGTNSVAAGNFARAEHSGSFVWSDAQGTLPFFASAKDNQFLIRAGGGVGINTNNTPLSLSVKGLGANSELIGLRNDADQAKWHLNLKSGGLNFVETGVDDFRLFLKEGGNVGIGTSNPQGRLDVNGTIFQRGGQIHADYVFEDDYQLESIEEHARAMWRDKHLPAVKARTVDAEGREVVEYGARLRGILEELEKAHIYIEQLNRRLGLQDAEMARLRRLIKQLVEASE